MNSIYSTVRGCAEALKGYYIYSLLLSSLKKMERGREVRGQVFQQDACSWQRAAFAQGHFSRAATHWHESIHPVSHMLKDNQCNCSVATCAQLPQGSQAPLPHLISWTDWSLLLCLPTVQFLEGAGGNKPHYIAVCIGTALLRGERDLGCGPAWLPVTVKCFPVWVHRSHLSRQVHQLKWLPVWKCSYLAISLSLPLYLFSAPISSLSCPLPDAHSSSSPDNLSLSLTGSAVWGDGGGGGRRATLRPVHGSELKLPECPGSLPQADQWDFPQWGHEGHVRLI